ncbi:amidohydrolase family protein [Actinophytocola oryzae]|uniref:Tol biopolymer transport system component n=1 Tax=Actinophytocola oryzae TaxID=502181 RepID=A0A4R7VF42_9PSEU|nr:amidohydrolase family protein [Actinophytocola oryzae]TDV47843.1 Tol biopolymer transport system component [Actinophytocola oryzae]
MVELTRRDVLRSAGVLAGATALTGTAAAAEATADGGVAVSQGTNIAAHLSPDGRTVAFDLVTAIWTVAVTGGRARRLTGDDTDATQPSWSPDGRRLVFQAYRDGNYHLYTIRPDGSSLEQLTTGPYDHREPRFSPDGTMIAFASDRGGSYGVHTLSAATGAITTRVDTAADEAMPAWSPDGRRLAYTVDATAVDVLDLSTGVITRAVTAPAGASLFGPSFAPDGTLAYVRVAGATAELVVGDRVVSDRGEDVFGFAASWPSPTTLVYTADGVPKRRTLGGAATAVAFTAEVPVVPRQHYRHSVRDLDSTKEQRALGIASPVASRDGTKVAFRALNALWLLKIGDPRPVRLVADGYFNSDPDFTPDGRAIVYASDRAGDADLWQHDLASGRERRLSGLPGAQVAPRLSPDGGRVAYNDQDGVTWVLDLASGTPTQVTPSLFMPGRPTWSPDGRTVALAAVKPYSRRFREGTSQILSVDLASGALTYTEPMPHASLATRGDDGPAWSPDGKYLAFVVESCAWVVPVSPTGAFTGPARQVTTEVTDSLSWLGADRLLYLHNGTLRSVSVDGGRPKDIPLTLHWRPTEVHEHEVIRAGALWDGRAQRLRESVDIVVDKGKIVDVLRAGGRRYTVDARTSTVMPGLVDAHVHWHLRGRQWGDRQGRLWLTYGITTTRSPGDPAYQFVETREALESGARVGPRYFGTGEAIDGSRVYYNFMRPTRSVAQLGLELARAKALGYDMVKTYVRLPVAYQRRVVAAAHRAGMPLSSHYLYPAEHIGMDGMEHTGATNRLGYSHTVSRLGRAYEDAVTLFVRSGMSLTPTLFNSAAMYAFDRALVEDERTRTLYPAWEYAALVTKADAAQTPANEPALAMLAANVDMVLRIHRAGGYVISGTDAPLDNPAVSLHTNLRAKVHFGFTPYEALTTATTNPARWLGQSGNLGEVRRGAQADLSFVTGNPLADINAAAAVDRVMVKGRLHTVDDLLTPFRTPVAAATPALATTSVPATHEHDPEYWWHEPERAHRYCC